MYSPGFNLVADPAVLLEAMRQNAFALLVGPLPGADPTAAPVASHLPLVVHDEGPHGLVEGYFAKANRQWQSLAGHETLVVFQGPHGYVSPAHYTDPLSVPTWNYVAVHAWGTLELVEEEAAKDTLLKNLIALHEPAFADRWRAMPEGFRRAMLAGIVGFRILIARIEGKFKLSQNRPEADRARIRAAHAAGTPDEQALANWMQRLGL